MNFDEFEKSIYGKGNLEDDPELMAELMALQQEEDAKQSRAATVKPVGNIAAPTNPRSSAAFGIDEATMALALADDAGTAGEFEEDEELLNELAGLCRSDSPRQPSLAAVPAPTAATLAPALPPRHPTSSPSVASSQPAKVCNEQLNMLQQLLAVYEKMKSASDKENNGAKVRRVQRTTEKLNELIAKSSRGQHINPADIPPAPPGWQPLPASSSAPTVSQPESRDFAPSVPVRTLPPSDPATLRVAPPFPCKTSTASCANVSSAASTAVSASSTMAPTLSKKSTMKSILLRRRNAYVANGKAAVADKNVDAAKGCVQMSKMFDQAIEALNTAGAEDELDLNEIPPTPPPYRKKEPMPTTFMGALESRLSRYTEMEDAAKKSNNDRKSRMYGRITAQYKEAISMARKGVQVNTSELPFLPDMLPLPAQGQSGSGLKPAASPSSTQEVPFSASLSKAIPQPTVGPLAPSGTGQSRNATQLQFLLERQKQFKNAAIMAKQQGNRELAVKYLMDAKGFEKMILAAQSGLPVNIKDAPIPPQASATSAVTLQPRIAPSATSATGVESRGEVLALLEKGLIEQVQLAENNRMRFTRLGDVGKVKLFETWAKTSKQDLMLVRAVAKQGLKLPQFHYENRAIPSADLFPDMAEDVMELTITGCKDVPLPSGYEPTHGNVFVRYTFPYPNEAPQSGKTKYVSGTTSPDFNETVFFQIGTRKSRGQKVIRILKRSPLKLEVYQKGSFLRSDKLLGSCEWKLDGMESHAELEESLPLKDGRKAVGGLMTLRIRAREPLGDTKISIHHQKWIVLDS